MTKSHERREYEKKRRYKPTFASKPRRSTGGSTDQSQLWDGDFCAEQPRNFKEYQKAGGTGKQFFFFEGGGCGGSSYF